MPRRTPKLCEHKGRGLAYVTDPRTGKEAYFGPIGSAEAASAYAVWVRDFEVWRATGETPPSSVPKKAHLPTVADLCAAYLRFAGTYYRKRGKPTTEVGTLTQVLDRLVLQAGEVPAAEYGPRQLKALRDEMAAKPYARTHVNKQMHRVRRAWRWAVSEEMIPPACLEALRSVPGLAKGRTAAPESEKVLPVDLAVVEATLPFMKTRFADLVRFQLWAAMRPGEAVVCRPCDVDRSVTPWEYRPYVHKTEHREKDRLVYLGPKSRAALAPHLERTTPAGWVWHSRGQGPHRAVRGHLQERSYALAIEAAVLKANRGRDGEPVPHWSPLQLRHTAATLIRASDAARGLEAAQGILGHAEMNTTEIYAAKNAALSREFAERLG